MTKDAAALLNDVMALDEADRGELAVRLVESLEPADEPDVESVEAAWHAEIGRRLREIDAGRARFVSWPAVRDRLRARLDDGA